MYGFSVTELIFISYWTKLSQPNMAASSGLSGKMFFPATWNFNILNDIIIAMIYYPFDIIAL